MRQGITRATWDYQIAEMTLPQASRVLRARRRTYRLHFYHAIGFPSSLADDLILSGNLVGWYVTLRPLVNFAVEQLADHPDATDLRLLFSTATSVNTLTHRPLMDLMDWIAVRDDIWRQLRTYVHFNPIIHREASVLEWEARRRRTLENLRYIVLRNVDPTSTFANAVVAEWDLTTAQILESGIEMGDQIVAWFRSECEDRADGACMDALLPVTVQRFLTAVRSHHH